MKLHNKKLSQPCRPLLIMFLPCKDSEKVEMKEKNSNLTCMEQHGKEEARKDHDGKP